MVKVIIPAKKATNLAKSKKLKNHQKLSKSKKTSFKILINLFEAINNVATGYLTTKTGIVFTYWR